MQTRALRALLIASGICGVVACAPTEPAAAPQPSAVDRNQQIEQDQAELDRRRLQLETQLLTDLHKLREGRQASTSGAQPTEEEESPLPADFELLIFGGPHHEVSLGCLCDERKTDSVFNLIGEHGSDLSSVSIRNKFAPYGSNYDDTSACNAAATHPPTVLDQDGKSLGLLTMNTGLKRRITAPSVLDWLGRMCSQ